MQEEKKKIFFLPTFYFTNEVPWSKIFAIFAHITIQNNVVAPLLLYVYMPQIITVYTMMHLLSRNLFFFPPIRVQ